MVLIRFHFNKFIHPTQHYLREVFRITIRLSKGITNENKFSLLNNSVSCYYDGTIFNAGFRFKYWEQKICDK